MTPEELALIEPGLELVQERAESPIEYQIGLSLIFPLAMRGLKLVPQFSLGNFRYDFSVQLRDGRSVALIECDGKEFHSSAEQLRNDRNKEKVAGEIGLFVIRLTGAAITRNPKACAEWVIEAIRRGWRLGRVHP
jgi:very-short-patch-repair endonuclease